MADQHGSTVSAGKHEEGSEVAITSRTTCSSAASQTEGDDWTFYPLNDIEEETDPGCQHNVVSAKRTKANL